MSNLGWEVGSLVTSNNGRKKSATDGHKKEGKQTQTQAQSPTEEAKTHSNRTQQTNTHTYTQTHTHTRERESEKESESERQHTGNRGSSPAQEIANEMEEERCPQTVDHLVKTGELPHLEQGAEDSGVLHHPAHALGHQVVVENPPCHQIPLLRLAGEKKRGGWEVEGP